MAQAFVVYALTSAIGASNEFARIGGSGNRVARLTQNEFHLFTDGYFVQRAWRAVRRGA
jgi:hypothetical protein